jgi:hypothetical protein
MSFINVVTFVGLFVLSYSVAVVKAAADTPIGEATTTGGGPDIARITPHNIHERYALDIIREEHFHIAPDKVMDMMQQSGNTIIVAPDPSKGHPNLFHMTPQRYQVMQEDGLKHPTITVVVLKDTVAVSYRDKRSATPSKASKETLMKVCNHWNENVKVGTCYVDTKGKLCLHHEIQSVDSPQESTDHMVDSFNRILLDKGLHEFQISLQRFGKLLEKELMPKAHIDGDHQLDL